MRDLRAMCVWVLGLLSLLLLGAGCGNAPAAPPESTGSIAEAVAVGQANVSPVLECVELLGGDRVRAHFGYSNRGDGVVDFPIGGSNRFNVGSQDRGQPVRFAPGRKRFAFDVEHSGTLVWTLNGRTSTSSTHGPKCGASVPRACNELKLPCAGSQQSVGVTLPAGLSVQDVALHAQLDELTFGSSVKVHHVEGGFSPVSSVGARPTSLAENSETGDLLSLADATLGSNAIVHGILKSSGTLTLAAGAHADAASSAQASLGPLHETKVTYVVPPTHVAAISSGTAQTGVEYADSSLPAGAVLLLGAGEYHFDSLSVNAGSRLAIDNSAGPVQVFIYGAFAFRGSIELTAPERGNVLFAVGGCAPVDISASFHGVVFAPGAPVHLGFAADGHTGAFFGASVSVDAGTLVRHQPFLRDDCDTRDDGCGNTFGCSALHACPSAGDLAQLTPVAECVLHRPDGTWAGRFGYENASPETIVAPVGLGNSLSGASQFQTSRFEPGHHPAAFYVRGDTALTWSIGAKTATLSPDATRCADVLERLDSPVQLRGVHDSDSGTGTPGTQTHSLLHFEVPDKLRVSLGGSGNGRAALTYVNADNERVACSYRGGSRVERALRDLDRVRGRFYYFDSCSDGRGAGAGAEGSGWTLDVLSSDPTYSRTEVTVALGTGCSGLLDAPIPADVSVQTREAFSWQRTQPLAETGSDGLPTMYYAWIYIERKEQLAALRRMRIYHSVLPIFSSELSRYAGRCGSVDSAGDGTGIFVHAFVPGAVFNIWRSAAVVTLTNGKGTVPFRAVQVMPPPDIELASADGLSLSWAKIKESQLSPFGAVGDTQAPFSLGIPILDDVVEAVGGVAEGAVDLIGGVPVVGGIIKSAVQIGDDIIETSISIASTFDEIIETSVRLVDAVEGVVTDALGELEQWKLLGGGSINVNLDFTILNRDSLFNTANAMTRAWGAGNGSELPLSGLRVEVHKWSRFLLPTAFHGTLRDDGTIGLQIAKGGSVRGQSGLCLRLSNDAAEIASGITENEFCDFSVQPGEPGFTDDLDHDVNREFRLNDWQLHALNQLTDANKFARSVLRHVPPQAEVGVGFAANMVAGGNQDQPLTACLTFPEGAQLLTETAALVSVVPAGGAVVGAAGLLATPFIRRDMFLPETAEPRDSRGIVSHEYGHFIMCSLLHDIDPDALLRLYHDRLSEGKADARDDDVTVQSEAFADFIMSQVTSGTNYANFSSTAYSNFGNFCFAPPCVEENFRGLNEAPPLDDVFKDETRRYISLFHDAFDRRSSLWRTDSSLPTNSDAWEVVPAASIELATASTPYLSDVDDRVQLPGSSTVDWFESAIPDCASHAGPSQDCSLNGLVMQRGLVAAARHAGATWCDVCSLIANHSKNPRAVTRRLPDDLWQLCRDSRLESSIVGPPPDEQLRLDAATCKVCPPHEVSRVGQCLACPPDEVVDGNSCVPCPAGSVVGANFQCEACGAHAILVNNKCVECEFYEAADRATNTCQDCPADVVIDWRDVPAACPTETITVASSPSPAGDTCPNAFWIEVTHLDDLVSRAEAEGSAALTLDGIEAVTATPNPTTQSACELSHTTTSRLLGNAGDWVSLGGAQGSGKWTPASQCSGGLVCLTPASCDFPTTLVPRSEIVGAPRNLRILAAAGFGNVPVPSRTAITATLAAGEHSRCRVR